MKVLLCTPYRQDNKYVSGGVNVWGNNLIQYYSEHKGDIILEPISYDRLYNVKENTSVLSRLIWGVKDYWSSIRKTKDKIKHDSFDVLHLCTSAQLSLIKDYYVLRFAKKHKIKTTIHLHFGRIPELFETNNWETYLLKKVAKIADMVIVMDSGSYETLKAHGYNNVSYLPNPLSSSIIEQVERNENKIKRLRNKIVFVGHVIPSKGVYELVNACCNIPQIEVHLIGSIESAIEDDLIRIAKKRSSAGCLKIRGSLSHKEVILEMLSAGVFVLPSYTEGFPNVILEAMACSCPIVATAVGAIPEILNIKSESKYGICVKVKDENELETAIKRMLDDYLYAEKCGKNARKRVIDLYSIKIVWEQLVDLWREL